MERRKGKAMSIRRTPFVATVLPLVVVLAWATIAVSGQYGPKNGEWRYYGGDAGSTKYSPLDQINKDNVKDLKIVWRWKAENLGPRPDFNFEATPLMVNGVLYTTAGSRRDAVAIDGETGETYHASRVPNRVRLLADRSKCGIMDGDAHRWRMHAP
jgi:glucose dehydrogenase